MVVTPNSNSPPIRHGTFPFSGALYLDSSSNVTFSPGETTLSHNLGRVDGGKRTLIRRRRVVWVCLSVETMYAEVVEREDIQRFSCFQPRG